MVSVLVGCPVRARSWVLPTWRDAIFAACAAADMEPLFVFVVDPTDETFPMIVDWAADGTVAMVLVDDPVADDLRAWYARPRLEWMAHIRNRMLEHVRLANPGLFWSVDSDIVVHPLSLLSARRMITEHGYSAVATLTWMHPVGTQWPNCGTWDARNGGLRRFRVDIGSQISADVIMAAKLMTPPAYRVDYRLEPRDWSAGEDVGWSLACRAAGLSFGVDGVYPAKHAMSPQALAMVDKRCGW